VPNAESVNGPKTTNALEGGVWSHKLINNGCGVKPYYSVIELHSCDWARVNGSVGRCQSRGESPTEQE
jgi:hypothetical protein